jgi:hypothetical protein
MAHALSADRSAVSKSIATSFIAMASLKIQFFTRHREAGTQRPPVRRHSIFLHLQLPRKDPRRTAPVAASTALSWHWLRAHVLVIGRRHFAAYVGPSLLHRAHRHYLRGLPGHEAFDVRRRLKPGDLMTELDGTPVRDAADLRLVTRSWYSCVDAPYGFE